MVNTSILSHIINSANRGKKLFALLIDPEKFDKKQISLFVKQFAIASPDFIFVGGSQLSDSIYKTVELLKSETTIPIISFPGNCSQFAENVDALLFLSLISGRNPKFLIEHQIAAARKIKLSNVESLPTGYILIDGGIESAVARVSHTSPYQNNERDMIIDTAIAGELLGHKLIYLEAGSGAKRCVTQNIITDVKRAISIPLIVGGGICNCNDIENAISAGADIVVVGNHLEKSPEDLSKMVITTHNYKDTTI